MVILGEGAKIARRSGVFNAFTFDSGTQRGVSPERLRDWQHYSSPSSRLKVPLRRISDSQSRPYSRRFLAAPSPRTNRDSPFGPHKTVLPYSF